MQKDEQQMVFDGWSSNHQGLFFKVVRAYAFTPHDQEDLFSGDRHAGIAFHPRLARRRSCHDLDLSRGAECSHRVDAKRAETSRGEQEDWMEWSMHFSLPPRLRRVE